MKKGRLGLIVSVWKLLTCLEESSIGGDVKGVGGRSAGEGDDGLELAGLSRRGGGGEPGEGGEEGDGVEVLHFETGTY